jgi:hypothetical protein
MLTSEVLDVEMSKPIALWTACSLLPLFVASLLARGGAAGCAQSKGTGFIRLSGRGSIAPGWDSRDTFGEMFAHSLRIFGWLEA